jgi:hypothetical protein
MVKDGVSAHRNRTRHTVGRLNQPSLTERSSKLSSPGLRVTSTLLRGYHNLCKSTLQGRFRSRWPYQGLPGVAVSQLVTAVRGNNVFRVLLSLAVIIAVLVIIGNALFAQAVDSRRE